MQQWMPSPTRRRRIEVTAKKKAIRAASVYWYHKGATAEESVYVEARDTLTGDTHSWQETHTPPTQDILNSTHHRASDIERNAERQIVPN